ncbi:MAG: rod shape-determining protein MreC [Clostridia bacterium]|nr:rod shape-determining protein MreC [Clostridia bacterium]MBQ9988378.1 rod shape-determining protein MreC [Clostridia bacterium]
MRFWNNRPLIITVAIIFVLLVVLVALPVGGRLSTPGNVVGSIATGTQSVLGRFGNWLGTFFRSVFQADAAANEVTELKQRVALLEQQNQEMNELREENERLRQLLNYAQNNQKYSYITGRVISRDPGYFFDVFTINAGYNDGVEINDAVVTEDGLVGRVTETGGGWSRVVALIDPSSSVSGTVERTRDMGVVSGTSLGKGTDASCEMSFIPLEAELVAGDRVITNGLGGVYPAGFLIGTVVEVSSTSDTTGKTVLIKPAVDFTKIEEVLIVKMTEETE